MSINEDFENLSVEKRDDVIHVVLDRPSRLNAVDGPLHHELTTLFAQLRHQDDLGAVVISGRGKGFCAGGDARWFQSATQTEVERMFRDGQPLIENLLEIPAPVIAAVHGPAVGLGATLALFCDIVIADEQATFADPHVRMGVGAGDGGAVIWPLRMGMRAKRYLLTGEAIDARKAERLGLIDEVVTEGAALDSAHQLAVRFATGPRLAHAGTKSAVNQLVRQMMAGGFTLGFQLERHTFNSADHREAVTAFAEGRQPKFTGR